MTGSQYIGFLLNSVTALTAIVSNRIYNGNRPDTTTVPSINYYELSGGKNIYGFQRVNYSINCRSATAETSLKLAIIIDEIFNGSSGTGTFGYASNGSAFENTRSFTVQRQGLIAEPDDNIYNAPVDVCIIYPSSSNI